MNSRKFFNFKSLLEQSTYYPTWKDPQEEIMASITKKIKEGRPYYYAVESKRIDGKPRIVW